MVRDRWFPWSDPSSLHWQRMVSPSFTNNPDAVTRPLVTAGDVECGDDLLPEADRPRRGAARNDDRDAFLGAVLLVVLLVGGAWLWSTFHQSAADQAGQPQPKTQIHVVQMTETA